MSDARKPGAVPEHMRQPIADKLSEKIGDRCCEMCGGDEFVFNSALASPMFLSVNQDNKPGIDFTQSHPCVVLQCKSCGNTKFFSLTILGLPLKDGVADD